MNRELLAVLVVGFLLAVAGPALLSSAAAQPENADAEIGTYGPGTYTVDVSDQDWIYADVTGAAGDGGSDVEGEGGLAHGWINVTNRDTVTVIVAAEGDTDGWNDGETGDGGWCGDGAGSTAVGWGDEPMVEAGGGQAGDSGSGGSYYCGQGGGEEDNGGTGGTSGGTGSDGSEYINDTYVTDGGGQTGGGDGDGSLTLYTADYTAPTVSNPQPSDGTQIDSYNTTISIDVTDADFGEPWGDQHSVEVTFYDADDDSVIGSETLTANGTASAEWTGMALGRNNWYAVANDSEGNQATSSTHTVTTPGTLDIRDETTLELIDDSSVNVTVEFFPQGSGGELVEKQAVGGTVDLDGLDTDREYTISVRAEGYHSRTTILRNIADQQTVYMLPDDGSVDTVDVQFQLEDYSGQYDSSTSRLLIQRPIEENGERKLQTVAADTFGAGNQYTATLEQDQRYVLIVENEDGIERPQGDFVARESGITVIEVGTITWTAEETGYSWRADYQNSTNGAIVTFAYSDPTEQTGQLQVTVYERTNPSNVLTTETFDGPLGNASFTADVPADQRNTTWEVSWTATRNGEEIEGSRVVSGRLGDVENPFQGPWGVIVVGMLLTFVSLVFGGSYAATGTVVVAGFASLLWWIGWLPVSGLVMLGVLIIAALYAGGDRV